MAEGEEPELGAGKPAATPPSPGATPWWTQGWFVTALTTILASVVPITAAVNGHFEKEKELELEAIKQADQIRAGYLDRLKGDPVERARTLRFLIETTSDERLRVWAKGESDRIEADIAVLKAKIDQDEKDLVATKQRADELSAKEAEAEAQATKSATGLAKAQEQVVALAQQAQAAQQSAAQKERQLALLQEELHPSSSYIATDREKQLMPTGRVCCDQSGSVCFQKLVGAAKPVPPIGSPCACMGDTAPGNAGTILYGSRSGKVCDQ
jgi:hypothetical protein